MLHRDASLRTAQGAAPGDPGHRLIHSRSSTASRGHFSRLWKHSADCTREIQTQRRLNTRMPFKVSRMPLKRAECQRMQANFVFVLKACALIY